MNVTCMQGVLRMTPKMNSLMTTKEAMGINQTAHHELGIVVQDKLQSLSTGFQQLPTPCVVHHHGTPCYYQAASCSRQPAAAFWQFFPFVNVFLGINHHGVYC